jgi:nicotinamide riboside kinase
MRIAITGPECSGKSTLSEQLAAELNLPWTPEHARVYLERLGRPYVPEDVITIAKEQAAQWINTSFIADTEMLVCSIWYEEKTGETSSEIEQLLAQQNFDLYLLCNPDLPWEFDELRENPTDRDRLFERYMAGLDELSLPYVVINGSAENRVAVALNAVKALVKNNH